MLEREKIEIPIRPAKDVDLIADLRALHEEMKACGGDKLVDMDQELEQMREERNHELATLRGERHVETITLTVPESQVIEWVRHLSPEAKRDVLRALVPELDELDALADYGNQRIRQLCAERGIDWDSLAEEQRQQLIDELLHET